MTRTVTDTALMLDVLSGFDSRDWSALPAPRGSYMDGLADGVAGLRVAFSATLGYVRNDPEVEALVRSAAELLEDEGAHVVEVDPGFADPVEAFHALWFAGAAKVLEPYGTEAIDQVDPALRRGVETMGRISASEFLDATSVRMDLGVRMGAFHERFDLLLTPTMPITAFPKGQEAPDGWGSQNWTSWTPYTYPFNMTQQPAASVPCGFTASGLPVGLQIVGPRHADRLVLRAARAYEAAAAWPTDRPVEATPDRGEGR
jgi:aspartyl-tRNA(Asn)/glutamyl-tRNA(Gln) amidotransferase subunit A